MGFYNVSFAIDANRRVYPTPLQLVNGVQEPILLSLSRVAIMDFNVDKEQPRSQAFLSHVSHGRKRRRKINERKAWYNLSRE